MIFRFSRRNDVVVAIHARSNNFIVVDYIDGDPVVNVMTGFAKVRGRYVSWRFTDCGDVIMAGHATLITHHRMIHTGYRCRRLKSKRAMANFAGISDGYMIGTHAHRKYPIVASIALLR